MTLLRRISGALPSVLLVAAFLLALIAFGGRSMAWVVGATAAAAALAAIILRFDGASTPRISRGAILAAAALVALPCVSLLPMPQGLAGALSTRRVAIATAIPNGDAGLERWLAAGKGQSLGVDAILRGEAAAAPREAAAPGESAAPTAATAPGALRVSFDPPATVFALAVLACFIALLLALSGASERFGLRILGTCGVATALMGIYAIIWAHFGNGKIYGIFAAPPNVGQQPFGPFWNPNHFAALLAAFGILSLTAIMSRDLSWRMRAAACGGAIVFWLGLADAGSRGGVLGATAGLVVLGVVLLIGPASRRVLGAGMLGLAILGLVLATLVAPEKILEQSLETATEMSGSNFERTRIYRAELSMVTSAPLVGVGLGSFRMAYPAFQAEPDPLVPLHGESDWLESLAEGGVPLAVAWLALIASLAWPALRAARRPDAPILLAGLIAAVGALVAHAAVDFHLREPSVGLIAIIMAGTASAWGSRLLAHGAADEAKETGASRALSMCAPLFALVGILILAALWGRIVPWDRAMRRAEFAFATGEPQVALDAALAATKAWPARAASWSLAAACEEQLARKAKPRDRAAHRERALAAAVEALRRNPLALGAARTAGQVLLSTGSDREALEAAELALLVAPGHASAHRLLGQVLLRQGRHDDALPRLAFAFDAMPFEQVSQQGVALARMVRDAGRADAARIFTHMTDREARVRYIHRLLADAHEDETGACLAVVMKEGVPARDADAWAYALVGGSPEAAELGRRLLPNVTEPISRVRIAKALLAVADTRDSGTELLRRIIAEAGAPADGFVTLALDLRARGQGDESVAIVNLGLAAHPTDPALLSLRR